MNTKAILKYVVLSVIPMLMAKGAVFFANIVTTNQVSVVNFSRLSEIYLCVAIMATPVISALNQYVSVSGVEILKLIKMTILLSVITSILSSIYYIFVFNDSFQFYYVVVVFFFTIALVVNGCVSAIFIGSGAADKLNVAALLGGMSFALLTFIFVFLKVSWYYYLILYAIIPMFNIIISPFLIRANVVEPRQINSSIQSNKVISKLLLITMMGAPIQLSLVAILRSVDISGNEISRLNIAYQWHMLIILLPTMISSILLKFLTEKKSKVHRLYRTLSYLIAGILAFIVVIISNTLEDLYGSNGIGISSSIIGYSIAGMLSVIYHVKLNTLLSEFAFNEAMIMVGSNALIYLIIGWVGLLYYPITVTLSVAMSISYCTTLALTKLRNR